MALVDHILGQLLSSIPPLQSGVAGRSRRVDWALIGAHLEENARLFGIHVDALLNVDGVLRAPEQVYRKVAARQLEVLV